MNKLQTDDSVCYLKKLFDCEEIKISQEQPSLLFRGE